MFDPSCRLIANFVGMVQGMRKQSAFIVRLGVANVCLLAILFCSLVVAHAQERVPQDNDVFGEEPEIGQLADPLEPLNRAFFHFNDKFYFWLLKPVSQGYSYVIPEDIRMTLRSFVKNLMAPVRIVNNLLQGKIKNTGIETARFVINSTIGIGGLADVAKEDLGLAPSEEDFGQTLGVYGVGEGIYFCWPFFGPSNVRDTIGLAGDFFLNPLSYLAMHDSGAGLAAQAGKEVNETSLSIGDYEDFKESALDPYVALRDAYRQHRQKKIRDISVGSASMYTAEASDVESAPAVIEERNQEPRLAADGQAAAVDRGDLSVTGNGLGEAESEKAMAAR